MSGARKPSFEAETGGVSVEQTNTAQADRITFHCNGTCVQNFHISSRENKSLTVNLIRRLPNKSNYIYIYSSPECSEVPSGSDSSLSMQIFLVFVSEQRRQIVLEQLHQSAHLHVVCIFFALRLKFLFLPERLAAASSLQERLEMSNCKGPRAKTSAVAPPC